MIPKFNLTILFILHLSAGRQNRPENITFHLLHLSVMRDYIHHEFKDLRSSLASRKSSGEIEIEYDLERLIDDWVLMGFLVGNDFVPHLPNMHIKQDHLPVLYKSYSKVPSLLKYIIL